TPRTTSASRSLMAAPGRPSPSARSSRTGRVQGSTTTPRPTTHRAMLARSTSTEAARSPPRGDVMKHIGHRALLAWLLAAGVPAAWLSTGCTGSAGGPADASTNSSSADAGTDPSDAGTNSSDAGTNPSNGVLQMGAATAAVVESAGHVTFSVLRVGGSSGAV